MTKRLLATLALALSVLACGPTGEVVPIVTGTPDGMEGACPRSFNGQGVLRVDPTYGTALERFGGVLPVAWQPGYTARKDGSEVAVLDPEGNIVATTGNRYNFGGTAVRDDSWPGLPTTMFWACGEVYPE